MMILRGHCWRSQREIFPGDGGIELLRDAFGQRLEAGALGHAALEVAEAAALAHEHLERPAGLHRDLEGISSA